MKKNFLKLGFNLLLILFSQFAFAQVGQVLWEDEFNTLNKELWNVDLGNGCPDLCGWGNQELQTYQNDNVYIEEIPGEPGNYALVLEAKKQTVGGNAFTSGKVTTKNKLGVKYGMVEFRIKVPNDLSKGLWPAAWLLGTNEVSEGWPRCGEMDLMEMGQNSKFRNDQELPSFNENNLVGGNLIFYSDDACSNDNLNCAASISYDKWYNVPYTSPSTLTDRFMIYRMYWDENEIRLNLEDNGVVHNLYTGPFPIGADANEFRKPFYLLMNLAVGGNFTDALTDSQVSADLPGKMYIDYIRIKKWNGKGEVYTPEKLMANAGADKKINAGESLQLDASGSYGPIASYSWKVNGTQVSTIEKYEVALDPGDYNVELTITDANGNFEKDAIIVSVAGQVIGETIWEDQFNTFNADNWNVSVGNGCEEDLCGWGNEELETYQKDNVYVEEIAGEPGNYALVLEAKKETLGTNEFTSGKVTTENKVAIKYGVVEVRMKVPDLENGLWPAAWLLGINHRTAGWPKSGEIDMMEMGHSKSVRQEEGHSGSPNNFVGGNVIWYADQACDPSNQNCAASIAYDKYYTTPYMSSSPMNNRFVTYRMYWNESQIRLTAVDNGVEHDLYTNPFPLGSNEQAFKKPFYFILNLAVGGNFVGINNADDITAPFPGKMYIDYVKVSKWNGVGTVVQSNTNLLANAGADIILEDLDKNGVEEVNLNSSSSYGVVASYEWSESGVVLSQEANPKLSLSNGVHAIQLKIKDSAGNESVDDVKVTIREILWEENFNSFDSNIWNTDTGNGCPDNCGWGNQELEYYKPENVSIVAIENEANNNALAIEAKKENAEGFSFTSGKVTTKGKLSVRYGLIETRLKVPNDLSTGLWPAFWLLGNNIDEVGWPKSGEIDMMEMGHKKAFRDTEGFTNSNENQVTGANLIWYEQGACAGNADCAASIAFDKWYNKPYVSNSTLTDRFLIYRMYWDPNQIRLTVVDNGVEYDLYTGPFPLGMESQEFQKPFYLIANLAVGGNFTDAASANAVSADLPGKMLVDYIRVFKHNGYGEVSLGNGLIANAGADIIKLDKNKDGLENIILDGTGSINHNGSIVSYSWVIDGKEVGNKDFVSLELARGVYEVLLTIKDAEGNTATDKVLVTISNGGLAPVANAGEDLVLEDDNEDDLVFVTLDGSLSEATNSPISLYRWLENGVELAVGIQSEIELSTGIHTITLEVTDEDELVGTDEIIITIIDPNNIAPVADAGVDRTINDEDGDDFVDVLLDASNSTDTDGTIEKYEWFINNELVKTGVNPTINLSTGVYEITLKVTDDDGVSSTDVVNIIILDPDNELPIAIIGDDVLLIDENLDGVETYELNAKNSSDSDGEITSYVWKEDGIVLGQGVQLEMEFELGVHNILLEVTDNDGAIVSTSINLTVNQLPKAFAGDDIVKVDTDSNGNEIVQLNASGSSDADGTIIGYTWFYDGAEIGNSEIINYSFNVGANVVTLQVVDNFGSLNSDEITVFVSSVNNVAPVANAGEDLELMENDGDGILGVQLDANSSADADGEINSYNWYKDDILIAVGIQVTVELGLGEHNIVLKVTDNEGASDSDEILVKVFERINIALNKNVFTSSNENDGYKGALAVDGNNETRWASSFSEPEWIYVDLGDTYKINEVILNWEAAYGSAYQIQISNDANTWTTLTSESASDGEIDQFVVSGVGRYIRMFGTSRATVYGFSLFEFEVYGILVPATLSNDEIVIAPSVKIYPNPTKGPIKLNISEGDSNLLVTVSLITGQKIYQRMHDSSAESLLSIDLSDYANGVYIVSLKGTNINEHIKIIKQ
ncbi:PKD domain-containing protein [uncultured Polaribacter sp.]|uniref:PKD domain-containing protein n=1 Tax=uncultured Polaribacter sp. TaxID=174711 RepID=UPI0030DCB2F9